MTDSPINNRVTWLDIKQIIPPLHTWVWAKYRSGMLTQHWWDDMETAVVAWMPLDWWEEI